MCISTKKEMSVRMGWRGRGGGSGGRWPGRGPFSNLPPWQRPGWLFGYGRGLGYYGRGLGYYGRGYGYTSPYSCARFPWLPRWWWADPNYQSSWPSPPATDPQAELGRLQAEKEALARDIEEMKRHVEEGTVPSTWSRSPFTPYGMGPYAASPEQEKLMLEQQRDAIASQMESIKKRLEELEKGE